MAPRIQIRKAPQRWLTPAGGYLSGYSHTLNPYVGCAFGCSYCYVREMPVGRFREEAWGSWADVKTVDEKRFRAEWKREKAKGPLLLFFGSATDPYQTAEIRHEVTRSLLRLMAEDPPEFVLLQTRSPLVVRDTELIRLFGDRIRVSLTIETDSEDARKHFTPAAPPLQARWHAAEQLSAAGIPYQLAVSPLLPHTPAFAERLAAAAGRIVVDDFFRGDGSMGKRTERLGLRASYSAFGEPELYAPETADRFYSRLAALMPAGAVFFGQEGFRP